MPRFKDFLLHVGEILRKNSYQSKLDNEISTIISEYETSEFKYLRITDYLALREVSLRTIRERDKNQKLMVKLITLLMLLMYFCEIVARRGI